MNAKRAKAARRLAREASVGLPVDGYIVLRRKIVPVTLPNGKMSTVTKEVVGVEPRSTKGIYRDLKKKLKRAYRQ